jgi:hypothetical protein
MRTELQAPAASRPFQAAPGPSVDDRLRPCSYSSRTGISGVRGLWRDRSEGRSPCRTSPALGEDPYLADDGSSQALWASPSPSRPDALTDGAARGQSSVSRFPGGTKSRGVVSQNPRSRSLDRLAGLAYTPQNTVLNTAQSESPTRPTTTSPASISRRPIRTSKAIANPELTAPRSTTMQSARPTEAAPMAAPGRSEWLRLRTVCNCKRAATVRSASRSLVCASLA